MADGLNKVLILGNLCADPEMRAAGDSHVLNFRVAVNESWYDERTKERKQRVEYISCVLWGKRAQSLNNFLSKGSQLHVEGRLQTRTWDDKQGNKRYTTEVNVSEVILLDKRDKRADSSSNDADGRNSSSSRNQRSQSQSEPQTGGGFDDNSTFNDDDIPF